MSRLFAILCHACMSIPSVLKGMHSNKLCLSNIQSRTLATAKSQQNMVGVQITTEQRMCMALEHNSIGSPERVI